MNPVLSEVLAERFPTPAEVEGEKRRTPQWVDESALAKLQRRRRLVEAMGANCRTHEPRCQA